MEGITRANEEWRNDPVRLQEWQDELEARAEAFQEMLEHLKAAMDAGRRVGAYHGSNNMGGNGIWNRSLDAVETAYFKLLRDERWIVQDSRSRTYIGNMAAFGPPR